MCRLDLQVCPQKPEIKSRGTGEHKRVYERAQECTGFKRCGGRWGCKSTPGVRTSLEFAGWHKGCNLSAVHEPGCITLFTHSLFSVFDLYFDLNKFYSSFLVIVIDFTLIINLKIKIKNWKNSTCWFIWTVIVKLWSASVLDLQSAEYIITTEMNPNLQISSYQNLNE